MCVLPHHTSLDAEPRPEDRCQVGRPVLLHGVFGNKEAKAAAPHDVYKCRKAKGIFRPLSNSLNGKVSHDLVKRLGG